MIRVMLMGGLGNQMFQYAAAKSLALRHQVELVLDLSFYESPIPGCTPRGYELGVFALEAQLQREDPRAFVPKGNKLLRLFKRILHKWTHPHETSLCESQFEFNRAEWENAGSNSILNGFWQSEEHFKDHADLIRADFVFRQPIQEASPQNMHWFQLISESATPVSLHVRRGDYVSNPNAAQTYHVLDIDYYKAALETLRTRVGPLQVFVFSDDMEWCKAHLDLGPEAYFVDNNTGAASYWDLRIMSACKHHIIANSSFSWWGAWLNPKLEKCVIAPKVWFKDDRILRDLMPCDWIQL